MHKYRFFNYLQTAFLLAATGTLCLACQGPEPVVPASTFNQPKSEEYNLDVYMLSEWASRIVPQEDTLTFKVLFENSDTCQIAINTSSDPENKSTVCLDAVLEAPSQDNFEKLYFHPYGYRDDEKLDKNLDVKFECSCIKDSSDIPPNPDEPDDLNNPDDVTSSCIVNDANEYSYSCTVYRSGTWGINYVWNTLMHSDDSTTSIHIGSGDNIGAGLPLSNTFNEIPTVQMLNYLDFTVDTFGNHSFDSSLNYLQNIINSANYKYIITNFFNLPNNLLNTSSYIIRNIYPTDSEDKEDALKMAIVGVLDSNAKENIARGRFGTLTITDYCSVINTLEEAYNQNARAFLILAHIFTDKSSIIEFFNALFSLDKAFADAIRDNHNDENSSLFAKYPCESQIVVTQKMLDAYRTNEGKSNASADDMRDAIHKEILNNIIMVFGETNDQAFLTQIVPGNEMATGECKSENDIMTFNVNGCYDSADKPINDVFVNHSILNYYKSTLNNRSNALNALGLQSYSMSDTTNTPESHIRFIELPSKGFEVAKASFKIISNNDDEIAGISGRFLTQLTGFQLEPVFDMNYNPDEYDKKTCDDIIASNSDEFAECNSFYEDAIQYKIDLAQSVEDAQAPSSEACQQEMIETDYPAENIHFLNNIQEMWTCLYNATHWIADCQKSQKCEFKIEYVCSLGNYRADAEDKDYEIRIFSTFASNFVTDALLKYLRSSKREQQNGKYLTEIPDAVLLNSGAIRELISFNLLDQEVLSTLLPYVNYPILITVNAEDLATILEDMLSSGTSGAFPAFAGFNFSYTRNNSKIEIQEILLTNDKQHYTTLYYLSDNMKNRIKTQNEVCLFGLKTGDVCRYGKYEHSSDKYTLRFNDCSKNEFCLNANNSELTYSESSSSNIKVAISDYLATGGDTVASIAKLGCENEKKTSICNAAYADPTVSFSQLIKDYYADSYEQPCSQSDPDTGSVIENIDVIKLNMLKRMFTNENVSHQNFDIDTAGASCIATQKKLAKSLGIYDLCHYEDAPPAQNQQ